MSERFADLKKIPADPAARMLANANVRLKTPQRAPASAPVPVVLAELEAAGAHVDLLRLLAVALPPREAVWWACLAARDLLGEAEATPALLAAEAWVRKPGDQTREAARATLDHAYVDDDTTLLATAVIFADGTLGTGDLAHHPAPAGATQAAVFGMIALTLALGNNLPARMRLLVDRAIDIARGGNGRVAARATEETA
jgi:hypothetical protein